MEKILVLVHTEDQKGLPKSAFESIGAARNLAEALGSTPFLVAVIGDQVQTAADSVAKCGAERIYAIEGSEFSQPRYSTDSLAIETLCKVVNPTVILAPATSRWSRVVPGVSYRLGGCVDPHITGLSVVEGTIEVERWYYRQRMVARIKRNQRPIFLTLDPGAFDSWQDESGQASFERVPVTPNNAHLHTQVTGVKAPLATAQTIRPEARLIFVAGAGWTKKQADGQTHLPEAENLILGFINQTQASLGSSKSLVDLSGEGQAVLPFLSHLNQVGQTGSTPRHPKGLATCCHGEEPHVVGWRFINERRAVNLDAACGWANGKTDVLYVADAFKVMDKVNELLKAT